MSRAEKPKALALPSIEQVPPSLPNELRWIGWRAVWDDNRSKWTKPPHSPKTGEAIGAVASWAEHWLTFADALAGVKKHQLDNVGFVFKEGDGRVGIDFDNCRNPQTGEIHPTVLSWLKWLPSYAEVSPSGTGVHVICIGKIPKALIATALPDAGDTTVEIYSQGRYFTFTGQQIGNISEVKDTQSGLDKLFSYLGTREPGVPGTDQQRPMSKLTARRLHQQNLIALTNAIDGEGNSLLNTTAFFAGRAFAAGVFEQTEQEIRGEILKVVCEVWAKPHPRHSALSTIESGWLSGIENPLHVIEDDYPEYTELIESFNKQFYVIEEIGGKCRVACEKPILYVKGKSFELVLQTFNDFRNRFLGEKVTVGMKTAADGSQSPIRKDKGDAWLESRHKIKYREVIFAPLEVAPAHVRNLWQGMAYEAKKGSCKRYLAHLLDNVCNGEKFKYDYLIGWMAYAVRNPNEIGHTAICVSGEKGVGKNVFAEAFGALWGQHAILISGDHGVTSNFNAHLRDKVVLIADEAFFAGDPRQDRVLKGLITNTVLSIEAKGVDKVRVPNFLHIIIIGNDDRLVNATVDERRYFSIRCNSKRRNDHQYFSAINHELQHGGYEALLYHLLYEVDVSKFEVRRVPKTHELLIQIGDSLRGAEAAWYYCLVSGNIPGRLQGNGTVLLRMMDFLNWASRQLMYNRQWGQIKPQQVGHVLTSNPRGDRPGMNFEKIQPAEGKDRRRGWIIPSLKEARKKWDELRNKTDWPDPEGEWDPIDMENL